MYDIIYNSEVSYMSSIGNKGKFSERIKKINSFKRKKQTNVNEIIDSKTLYVNFSKVVAAIPGFIYGNTLFNKNVITDKKIVENKKGINIEKINILLKPMKPKKANYKLGRVIKNINVSKLKQKEILIDNVNTYNGISDKIKLKNNIDVNGKINTENDNLNEQITIIEKKILSIMKQRLIKAINELEILKSELYILAEIKGDNSTIKECQREINQVKSLLNRVKKLKEQYAFLRDNFDFEYLLEIDDGTLIDKIIEYKNLLGMNQTMSLFHDSKIMEEYKYLYLKLDSLQKNIVKLDEKREKEIEDLKIRDINFASFKDDIYSVDRANQHYSAFVKNQQQIMDEIDNNVLKIDSHEVVEYHLKGFNRLFFNTFKYFGLLMLSPLKGVIPSIATETLITRNVINNLRNNLQWKENKKMIYEAIDYSSMINNAINDLDDTSRIVDTRLDDIIHLKMVG